MEREEYIREFSGQILGFIENEDNGDRVAHDFPSRLILGYYRKQYDYTTDFYGHVLGKGDFVVSLIHQAKNSK